eukprot:2580210-Rhodomonas_salina.1
MSERRGVDAGQSARRGSSFKSTRTHRGARARTQASHSQRECEHESENERAVGAQGVWTPLG